MAKVHATPINSWNWDMLTSNPLEYHLLGGLLTPTITKILGCDIAGRIEAVGRSINQFHLGDDVFGDLCEVFGEVVPSKLVLVKNELTLKTTSMTFEEAAAIPQAGVLALQGLCNIGRTGILHK